MLPSGASSMKPVDGPVDGGQGLAHWCRGGGFVGGKERTQYPVVDLGVRGAFHILVNAPLAATRAMSRQPISIQLPVRLARHVPKTDTRLWSASASPGRDRKPGRSLRSRGGLETGSFDASGGNCPHRVLIHATDASGSKPPAVLVGVNYIQAPFVLTNSGTTPWASSPRLARGRAASPMP